MVVEIGLLVLSIGLSLLAGYLLQKKNKSLVQDDKPTTLATRGSFLPLVKGRRRLGPIFGWAGNRFTRKEKVKGGKGNTFSTPKQDVFYESGWHLLCVGPARCLYEIEQNGTPIMVGPISSTSHPSGSLVDLGKEGSFRIYWGENTQPVNTEMGAFVGVNSRWPQACYVYWVEKRIGPQPNWPQMTYVVEVGPQSTILSHTPQYIEATQVLDGPTYNLFDTNAGGAGVGYFEIIGNVASSFKAKQKIEIAGDTGGGNGTYTVRNAINVDVDPDPFTITIHMRVFVDETVPGGMNADGTLQTYTNQLDDGWNGAHMLAELLFGAWPHGLNLDQSEWDMASLEALATLLDENNENLRCSMIAPQGQEMRGQLGGILQDLGVMLPIDMRTGLLEFLPVRQPVGTIPHIPVDAQVQRPEIEVQLGSRPVDRIIFAFSDEDNAFRDMTITIDDDGQAARATFFRARSVQIISTSDFDTAARMSQRRQFEELAGGADFRIFSNRAARTLKPGEAITAEGFEEVLRVLQTKHDPLSGQVEVVITPDFYGGTISSFLTNRGNTGGTGQEVQEDIAFDMVEIPEILAGQLMTVLFVYVRAHSTITGHNLHISRDNSTYTFALADSSIMCGGELTEPVDDAWEQDNGPEFTLEGPDANSVLDLTTDAVSWRNGRQLVVFVDSSGVSEVCFLKKITFVSGSTWRLDGLIRARYDTRPLSLPAGTKLYILQDDDGTPIVDDPLFDPEVTLYGKAEPTGLGNIQLSTIQQQDIPLYGKGIRPVPVSNIKLDVGSGSAGSGTTAWGDVFYAVAGSSPADDLILTWSYSTPQSPGTGAGLFGAGGTTLDPAPEGDFLIEVLNSGDVVQRTLTVSTNSWTYTRADRLADFTSEPSLFKLRVTQIRGGQQADPVTQTFTKTN